MSLLKALNLPRPEDIRDRQESRKTAENRREHYVARIAAAPTRKQKLAEAFDYLRAAIQTDDEMDRAITELVAMADRVGGVR